MNLINIGLNMNNEQEQLFNDQEELHRMQLAAIMTAAIGNTRASTKIRLYKDNPYWTVAYKDVRDAVDREIVLREKLTEAEAEIARLKELVKAKADKDDDSIWEWIKAGFPTGDGLP